MKIKCLANKGDYLRQYEYIPLDKDMMGRFGSTSYSEYNEITIEKEYNVMGIITFQTCQAYLVDDECFISVCPCQFFDVVDNTVPNGWYFGLIEKGENIYPFIQAIAGYYELCEHKKSYEELIINKNRNSEKDYFKRKLEIYG